MPGDACNRNEQCEFARFTSSGTYYEDHECIEGKCKHVPPGEACIRDEFRSQCSRGFVCGRNNTCVTGLPDV